MDGHGESLTLSVEEAGKRLGIGRTLAYDLARRGEFPCKVMRLGRRLVVPRAALDRALELDRVPKGPRPIDAPREAA